MALAAALGRMGSESPGARQGGVHRLRARASPAAIVVPTHEHLTPPAADGAVGLIAVIIVLVRAFQEAVLGSSVEAQRPMGRAAPRPASAKTGGKPSLRALPLEPRYSPRDTTLPPIQSGFCPDHTSGKGTLGGEAP